MRKVSNWVMGVAMDQVRPMFTDPRSNLPYHLNKVERRGLHARTPEQLTMSAEQEKACLVGVRLIIEHRLFEALVPVVLVDNRVDVAESIQEGIARAFDLAHRQFKYGHFDRNLTARTLWMDCRPMNLMPAFSETFGRTVDAPVAFLELVTEFEHSPFPNYIHDGYAVNG